VEVSCNLRTDQLLLVLDQGGAAGKEGGNVVHSSSYELPKTPVTVSYRVPGREDIEYSWNGHLSRYEGIGLDSKSRTVPVRVTVDNPREVYRNGEKIDEAANGGLPALVNGMFVDLAIHTQPTRQFVLLPKLALLPGNQVLIFQIDPELIRDESDGASKPEDSGLNVADWEPGRIRVVDGVKVIRTTRPFGPKGEEYWVAESNPSLSPGSLTVVSPMATLVGDGSDTARFEKKSLSHRNLSAENSRELGAK
jgi:hypothetical protein